MREKERFLKENMKSFDQIFLVRKLLSRNLLITIFLNKFFCQKMLNEQSFIRNMLLKNLQ